MGVVFLARDVSLERPVAIKLLPPHLADDDGMRARFVREARTSAKLSHPNIVPIHSVEEHGGVVFFVMGFVDGETLAQRVRRAGPLSARDGAKLLQEIAWALAYAHSAGVVHRDVKPDNVLIERATGRAMLTDFGIARVADGSSLTGVGEVIGTAQYVSPEQASGSAVDGRSDLYSLGVTAFYALSGRLPFQSPTLIGMLGMHLTQPAPPLASVRDGLPPKLAGAVDRCLLKDPADRFQSGEQLADAIADARGADVEVPPVIRAFLRDRARTLAELVAYYAAALYLGAFGHVRGNQVAIPLGILAVGSVVRLLNTARKVLTAGLGFDDVRKALLADAARELEERGLTPPTAADERYVKRQGAIRGASLVVTVLGVVALRAAGVSISWRETGWVTWRFWSGLSKGASEPLAFTGFAMVIAGVVALTGNLIATASRMSRTKFTSSFRVLVAGLWLGALGKSFFTVAGIGLMKARHSRTEAPVDAMAHTEVLLAKAADDLIAALPATDQAQLEAGREVIESLRAHIARLRAREEQLGAALAEVGPLALARAPAMAGANVALVARRDSLANELEQAQRDVAARRASAVVALENIRLQLIRLRAGVGSLSDLTADLNAARDIERQISAMVEVNAIA